MKGKLKTMLPFLEDDELEELADAIIASPTGQVDGISAASLAPFLEDDKVDEMFIHEVKINGHYKSLLPFVSEDVFDALLKEIINGTTDVDIKCMLPFMDDSTIDDLCEAVVKGKITGIEMTDLLPFCDDEDLIDEAFLKAARDNQPYTQYLPFVSDDCLHRLAVDYCKGLLDEQFDIDALYKYMEDDDIKMIFRHALNQAKNNDSKQEDDLDEPEDDDSDESEDDDSDEPDDDDLDESENSLSQKLLKLVKQYKK